MASNPVQLVSATVTPSGTAPTPSSVVFGGAKRGLAGVMVMTTGASGSSTAGEPALEVRPKPDGSWMEYRRFRAPKAANTTLSVPFFLPADLYEVRWRLPVVNAGGSNVVYLCEANWEDDS